VGAPRHADMADAIEKEPVPLLVWAVCRHCGVELSRRTWSVAEAAIMRPGVLVDQAQRDAWAALGHRCAMFGGRR
jgi:hypothetical protein